MFTQERLRRLIHPEPNKQSFGFAHAARRTLMPPGSERGAALPKRPPPLPRAVRFGSGFGFALTFGRTIWCAGGAPPPPLAAAAGVGLRTLGFRGAHDLQCEHTVA